MHNERTIEPSHASLAREHFLRCHEWVCLITGSCSVHILGTTKKVPKKALNVESIESCPSAKQKYHASYEVIVHRFAQQTRNRAIQSQREGTGNIADDIHFEVMPGKPSFRLNGNAVQIQA